MKSPERTPILKIFENNQRVIKELIFLILKTYHCLVNIEQEFEQ